MLCISRIFILELMIQNICLNAYSAFLRPWYAKTGAVLAYQSEKNYGFDSAICMSYPDGAW